jgi:hypothetical protein
VYALIQPHIVASDAKFWSVMAGDPRTAGELTPFMSIIFDDGLNRNTIQRKT